MKMKFPEIDAKRFYQIGKYVFFTMGLIGMIRVVDLYSTMQSYDIFSSLAYNLFEFVLSAFFANMQKKEDIAEVNDGDIIKMEEVLAKLNLEDNKNGKKK